MDVIRCWLAVWMYAAHSPEYWRWRADQWLPGDRSQGQAKWFTAESSSVAGPGRTDLKGTELSESMHATLPLLSFCCHCSHVYINAVFVFFSVFDSSHCNWRSGVNLCTLLTKNSCKTQTDFGQTFMGCLQRWIQLWADPPTRMDQNLGLVVAARSSLPQTLGKFSFKSLSFADFFVWKWTEGFHIQGTLPCPLTPHQGRVLTNLEKWNSLSFPDHLTSYCQAVIKRKPDVTN